MIAEQQACFSEFRFAPYTGLGSEWVQPGQRAYSVPGTVRVSEGKMAWFHLATLNDADFRQGWSYLS